jgi:hypothetical protein
VSYSLDASVTHFISTSVPIQIQRNSKARVPYHLVHPLWVYHCVDSNKLLSVDPFKLGGPSLQNNLRFLQQKQSTAPVAEPKSSNGIDNAAIQPDSLSNSSSGLSPSKSESPTKRMQTSEENPNFINDYLSQSRLHHLSSWKARLISQIKENLGTQPITAGRSDACHVTYVSSS